MKISLDKLSFKEIILKLKDNNESIIFYNDKNGNKLNGEKVLKIIYYINKYDKNIDYYFYNIPFCFFKKFGSAFIEEHCIKNRLCNYYDGYITYNKCNKCKYGLFCNNFNKNIEKTVVSKLEGYYEETIKEEELLEILIIYNRFVKSLGYKENEFCFYSTQKYIVEFLKGEIKEISKLFLNYLTIYFLLDNKKISKNLFESLDSFTLVFKDNLNNNKFYNLVKKYGINLNFTIGKEKNILEFIYKGDILKLDNYYSRIKYFGINERRIFFDFNEKKFIKEEKNIFKGKVLNGTNQLVILEKAYIIKNVKDFLMNKMDYYIGRDILGGLNLNNYKFILVSSDNLGDKGRLIQSLNSIKVPVIYDIKPDLTEYLIAGNKISIDFNKGIIRKIN